MKMNNLNRYTLISSVLPFLIIIFAAACLSVSGQANGSECFEVKYLDFFGFKGQKVSWPDSEIEGLLQSKDNQPTHSTNFLVPMIVKQIAEYHSCGNNKSDSDRFRKLVKLYLKFRRGKPESLVPTISADKAIELIRKDFYDQVNDDELLHELIFTMDDGPFKGENAESFPTGKDIVPVIINTRFGSIKFVQAKERIYFGALDKNDKMLWLKILQGASGQYLKTFSPEKINLEEFEAVGCLTLFVNGERLTVYLRPNGSFIYYTHSW